ncbi:hypothetical protein BGZ63DRAFT_468575 [Mariannaea sp. PMI_226]|nr:hypothetical protein BGZ63DRAFT_468575 [Mariannaea sp. PMI_226]
MPPIRTPKSNTFSGAQAPADNLPKRRLLKSVPKGVKDARFGSSDHDWDGKYEQVIRTSTRIIFGSRFVLTDLLGLFENCPNLTSVELTGASRGSGNSLSRRALDELQEHLEWVPKLKKLILGEGEHNKLFMKATRALTKERPGLTVTLLQRHEVKKWGDWELEETKIDYKKGRVA